MSGGQVDIYVDIMAAKMGSSISQIPITRDCDVPDKYIIVMTKPGEFKTSFLVKHLCFGLIIGSKHATRLAIARDTNTQITVPEPRGVDGHFQVVGPNRWNVAEARRQIETIADRALKRHSVMTNKLTRADLQELQDILKLMKLSGSAVSNSASVSD